MTGFKSYNSFQVLKKLAEKAPNLTSSEVLSPQRINTYVAESAGLKLFYATERVSDAILKALFDLAVEADVFAKMDALYSGQKINCIHGFKSENRAVLHTAMRDFFGNSVDSTIASESSKLAYAELEKLKIFLKQAEHFTDLIQIGIGGSSLGPEAMYLGLEAYQKKGRRVHFISNVDPDETSKVLNKVDLSKTLIVIVSKSGTTIETLTNELFIRDKLVKAGLSPQKHLVAVTGKGSPMDDVSKYLESFYIWDHVGGRYSATSMVGAVALSFAIGMEPFIEFLKGANSMDKAALNSDIKKNIPLLSALLGIWNRNFLQHSTFAVIPYAQGLARLPAHLQQLDMESNGKSIDKEGRRVHFETGPVVWGEPGTNSQHSFFQLVHQGTDVIPVEMICFKENQYGEDFDFEKTTSREKLLSNLFAQSLALAQGEPNENPNKNFEGNRPNHIVMGEKLTPFNLGALLAYYEHRVAFQGFIWNINSFDQEGVQLGKVLATKFMEEFSSKATKESNFALGKAFIKLIS